MPIVFTVVLLDTIGFGIVIPILPFLSPELGASNTDIALIIASYAACAGIVGPFWGRLSDRIGRKPVLIICLIGGALAYFFLGIAQDLWMIFAARAFAGLMAGNFGVAQAMMADISSSENRARGMGLIGAAFGLGLVLGPSLGGLLSGGAGNFMVPCFLAGSASLLATFAAAIFLKDSKPLKLADQSETYQNDEPGISTWSMVKETGNRLLILQYVLHTAGVSWSTYLFPIWVGSLLSWGPSEVGVVFGVVGGIMVFTQGLIIGPVVKMIGEIKLLRLGVMNFFFGLLMASLTSEPIFMVTAILIALTGATLCMPLLNTITSYRTPSKFRGQILGTTSSAAAWGRVVGPMLASAILPLVGFNGAWFGCAVLISIYLCWALFVLGHRVHDNMNVRN